ncbi:MAG: ATP-dependent RNA helicase RhlE [Chlamydiae bacterium]|nr:ATP-dependent RNA helicase RhlE [Chlamydiota bacterium]
MAFNKLCLDPQIVKAVTGAGYTVPTEIQAQAIPEILSGVDVRASAQTGTGKTAAFLLPTLNRLVTSEGSSGRRGPRILIVAPTRELAMQLTQQTEKYSKFLKGVKAVCISGGVSYQLQGRKLSKPYDVLIATPGRLIDYLDQGKIDLSGVEMLVLDEADRMLDMGFQEPMEQIVEATPESRQTLLFSATLQGNILKLSNRLMNNPVDVVVHAEKARHENIEQRLHYVDSLTHKNQILENVLNSDEAKYTIIFTSTKRHADQLVRELNEGGHLVAALHGDMNQGQRTRTVKKLKEGKINILVATDVAARGLDVQSINLVVNFDLPRCIEDYVHRIGRTGRAGANGVAISFAAERDMSLVRRIEQFTGQKIAIKEIEGLEPRRKRSSSAGNPKSRNRSNQSNSRFSSRSGGGGFRSGNSSRGRFARKSNSSFEPFGGKSEGGFRSGNSSGNRFAGKSDRFGGKSEGGFRSGNSSGNRFASKSDRFGGKSEGGFRSGNSSGSRFSGKSDRSFGGKSGGGFRSGNSSGSRFGSKPGKSSGNRFGSKPGGRSGGNKGGGRSFGSRPKAFS